MDMRRLVGRNVRRIRLEMGLTQEAFAEKTGFSQQYLSGIERGVRNPTIVVNSGGKLCQIAALNCTSRVERKGA
ncbi:MAG: helix-turn-helix transcriptional regulator [Methylocystis sp.]|nr:helix-turn-helix transcriptional regulator [Methylocystis sp.]MCA3582831.1 helix-turn-helix transcriptional regulator [Methylocystis sp.]MCA3590590.1 helix-turn-helix transcriptional regulator [Methylocystis sp.]